MQRIAPFLPYLAAAFVFGALLAASNHPSRLIFVVPTIGLVALIASGTLSTRALFRGAPITPGVLPGLLVASVSFADFFIEDIALRVGVAAVGSLLFLILVRHLHEAVREGGKAGPALAALSEWSGVMIVFSTTAGLLAASTYLNLPRWLASLIFAGVAAFSVATITRTGPASRLLASATAIILAEIFVALTFLPLSYWVSGGVLAAAAYLLFALVRGVNPRELRRSAMTAGALGLLLLSTARWR